MNPAIFPFMCVFFSFFHQSLVVFIVQILYILGQIYSKYFIVFDATMKVIVFFIYFSAVLLFVYGC